MINHDIWDVPQANILQGTVEQEAESTMVQQMSTVERYLQITFQRSSQSEYLRRIF